MLNKEISGVNLEEGFSFEAKPHKTGNSVAITIPASLIRSNQINPESSLIVLIKAKLPETHHETQIVGAED